MRWFSLSLLLSVVFFSCNGEIESVKKPVISDIEEVYEIGDIITSDLPNKLEQTGKAEPEPVNEDFKKELADTQEKVAMLMAEIQELKKIKPQKAKKKVPIALLLKDKAFKHTGHYGHGTKCRGKIYRKDFIKSRMYLHVDCNGNYTEQQVLKRR